jgi:hypothetical protein
MGKVRTSAVFYRRGVPKSSTIFGAVAQGNYSIVSTDYLFSTNTGYTPRPKPRPTIPGKPTNVIATVNGTGSVYVTWDAPINNGGSRITSYTVTSNPLDEHATWTNGPLRVYFNGLPTNIPPYTFSVVATNKIGNSLPSNPSNTVIPL